MNLRIETESWKLKTNDEGQKIISGSYAVKLGKEVVATKTFNDGYGAMNVTIPASIVAKAEALDIEIREAIVKSFEGETS